MMLVEMADALHSHISTLRTILESMGSIAPVTGSDIDKTTAGSCQSTRPRRQAGLRRHRQEDFVSWPRRSACRRCRVPRLRKRFRFAAVRHRESPANHSSPWRHHLAEFHGLITQGESRRCLHLGSTLILPNNRLGARKRPVNPNRAFLPRVMIRGERPHRAGHSGTVMTLLKAVLKAASD
jgi:hypothetical protein